MVVEVVTSFLLRDDKILILKRSQRVGTLRGKWAGVSGYLEEDNPLGQAYKEIAEETGLNKSDLELVKEGVYIDVPDSVRSNYIWRVHPFLFRLRGFVKITLDWEHDEMRWITPHELVDYDTAPDLHRALEMVLEV
jgi:8-oxo-dGTP pyrophosphatase MutT (NUDIX family)